MMRTFFVAIVASIATLVYAPIVVIAHLFRVPERRGSIYEMSARGWARAINRASGVRVRLHGAEHFPDPDGPGVVFASNHVSWFDIFAMAAVLPRYTFIAKAELRRIPVFGWAADAVGIVFLDRENRKAAFESYRLAAAEVQRGRSIVVCPEGTRGRDYHLRPFKKGPFVLAIAAQANVVPVIVYGAREVMPKGTFRIRPGVVDVHLLPPVSAAGYDYDERARLMTIVWERMADTMRSLYGVGTSEHPVAGQARGAIGE